VACLVSVPKRDLQASGYALTAGTGDGQRGALGPAGDRERPGAWTLAHVHAAAQVRQLRGAHVHDPRPISAHLRREAAQRGKRLGVLGRELVAHPSSVRGPRLDLICEGVGMGHHLGGVCHETRDAHLVASLGGLLELEGDRQWLKLRASQQPVEPLGHQRPSGRMQARANQSGTGSQRAKAPRS